MKVIASILTCMLFIGASFSVNAQNQEVEKKKDNFYLDLRVGTGVTNIFAQEALHTTGFNTATGINLGLRLFEFSNNLIHLESGLNQLAINGDLTTNDGKNNSFSMLRSMIPLRLQWKSNAQFAPHFSLAGYYTFDSYNLSTFPEIEDLIAGESRNSFVWGFSGGFDYNIPQTRNHFKLTISNVIDANQRTAYGISTLNTSFIFSISRYLF